MAILADLQSRLALYLKAEETVLTGHQSYSIGNQTYSKANLKDLQFQIRSLQQQIAALSQNGRLSHSSAIFGGRR